MSSLSKNIPTLTSHIKLRYIDRDVYMFSCSLFLFGLKCTLNKVKEIRFWRWSFLTVQTFPLGIFIHRELGLNRQSARQFSFKVSPDLWTGGEFGGVVESSMCREASPGPQEKDLAQMQAAMLTLSGPCGSSLAPPLSYFPSPQVAFGWHHPQTMPPIPMWIWAVTIGSHPPIKLYCSANPYVSCSPPFSSSSTTNLLPSSSFLTPRKALFESRLDQKTVARQPQGFL